MRPKRGPIITTAASASASSGNAIHARMTVQIIGGDHAGETGRVTFVGAGVAYVATSAGVVKVRECFLVAISDRGPSGPAPS